MVTEPPTSDFRFVLFLIASYLNAVDGDASAFKCAITRRPNSAISDVSKNRGGIVD